MSSAVPPHYRAFRIALIGLVLVALAVATWYALLPAVLVKILLFLGVR